MKSFLKRLARDRITWASDLHLDWINGQDAHKRVAKPAQLAYQNNISGWTHIVTGDITIGSKLELTASFLASHGVYFILGNHDRWYTTFAQAEEAASTGGEYYLHNKVLRREDWAMVGHNGFFDFRSGIVWPQGFATWDKQLIEDFKEKSYHQLAHELPELAEKNTIELMTILDGVDAPKIYLATHVPPFPSACLYKGKPSEEYALPFFCNTTLGEHLLDHVNKRPDVEFIVLAGHTHHDYLGKHAPNLTVAVISKTPTWNTNIPA